MKKKYLSVTYVAFFIATLFLSITVQSQSPFNCVTEAYLFQHNDVYAQNLASGNAVLDGINLTSEVINGVGYNDKDGYIWGSLKTSANNTIVRVGNNYEVTVYTVPGATYSYVGDINMDGIYYLKSGSNSFYKIDLDPESEDYLTKIGTGTLSQGIGNHDWAFNAADDMLYTVEKGSNILYKIDPATGNVTTLGEVPILSGLNYTYGAVYFDVDGNFYISANQTGTVYVVYAVQNVTSSLDMVSNLFAFGPSSSQNDGARCPTAPVPQEDCTNGVDDDGDGLVDCDDPACSGVAACPTITPTTTGRNGGLESNNRLSEKINQRNLNRIKTNDKFDRATAKRIYKSGSYGRKTSNTVSLWDFIPMDILEGTRAIESTPSDLVDITNATEVVAVDYITDNNEGAGTLLVLKTENSVYEHAKQICDRFTGSELLSVSNMEINEELFIKSIEKRPDGGIEYVASFSVRKSDDEQSYVVESHWNLDKYTQKGYYNFQIWASSIDDLYRLAEETLRLINIQKNITEYKSSDAPPIFIKKGNYSRGKIELDIVSTIGETVAEIEGKKRMTETSDSESVQFSIPLSGYVNHVTLDTQNLYDFGFRLKNEYDLTPDDLFLSDGTWGVDYSSEPFTQRFEVSQNTITFSDEEYGVERNFAATFEADQDVSIYRSLTPKFEKVDLSNYDIMRFNAKGTGKLKVILVKESIANWEDQPSITIDLSPNEREHIIYYNDLQSTAGVDEIILNDVKMIFFTLVSEGGSVAVEKTVEVNNIRFSEGNTAGTPDDVLTKMSVGPNPMENSTTFSFNYTQQRELTFEVFNILGKQVYEEAFTAKTGRNTINFERNNLASGLYFYKISAPDRKWKGKLLLK
ncbi:DUF6923 family protein [Tenacibaculum amylolyticum]|uniref:DUF6923 family protein n=1 Tax=Tenacibaculum amylolyticum TaxID=104269 RepID=UPI00389595E1